MNLSLHLSLGGDQVIPRLKLENVNIGQCWFFLLLQKYNKGNRTIADLR